MVIEYRPAKVADAYSLHARLRMRDKQELTLAAGGDMFTVLINSIINSDSALCATEDGKPICLWGCGTAAPGLGVPWMVGSPEVGRHSRRLITDGRVWVDSLLTEYSLLNNYVHQDNTTSIRWLKQLGFTIGALIPNYGVGRAPFFHFYRCRNV